MKGFKPPAAFKGRSEAKFQQKLREKHTKSRYLKTILPKAVKEGIVRDDKLPAKEDMHDERQNKLSDDRRRPKPQTNSAAVQPQEFTTERVKVWQGHSKPKGSQFTARGQPVMAHRLFKLTSKLERELNSGRQQRSGDVQPGGKHSGKWAAAGQRQGHSHGQRSHGRDGGAR